MNQNHNPDEEQMVTLLRHDHAPLRNYHSIIDSFVPEQEFQMKLVRLIDRYPFFLPPYLEMIELLEKTGQTDNYFDFLKLAAERIEPLLMQQETIPLITRTYSYQDLLLVKFLIARLFTLPKRGFRSRLVLSRALHLVEESLVSQDPEKPSNNIEQLTKTVDIKAMRRELHGKDHHWYARLERQQLYIDHIHTQAILLRNNKQVSVDPIPSDGPHESLPARQSEHFKSFLKFTEDFARERNYGLGRVALVRLRPGKLVYRHCDTEENLRTRTRFHLVIDADPGNILLLGSETARIKPGQLYRYENKVMHKSYNESDGWRVNLIFDAFPNKQ